MNRFRIVTNGKVFRIQRKGLFRWHWVGQHHNGYDGSGYVEPFQFGSDGEAVNLIRFKFGDVALIERPWYPSPTPNTGDQP